jgi:hypothetical protein
VLSLRPRQVVFVPLPLGLWFGRTTTRAPFEVPVLGSSAPSSSATCQFGAAPDQPPETVGTALRALVSPGPAVGNAIPIYFDGRDMRRAP